MDSELDTLLKRYEGYIRVLAFELSKSINLDFHPDFCQAGRIGLLMAYRKRDRSQTDQAWDHYARTKIRGAILDARRRAFRPSENTVGDRFTMFSKDALDCSIDRVTMFEWEGSYYCDPDSAIYWETLLSQLKPVDAEVVDEYMRQGLYLSEIGAKRGRSEAWAWQKLRAARKRLRKWIEKERALPLRWRD